MKALIKLGYGLQLVMPLDDAVDLIKRFENAEMYETEYKSGEGETMYISSGVAPLVRLDCITDDQYAVAKMRGPKPTKE